MILCRLFLVAVLLLEMNGISQAAFTLLGPIPYRSAADSPFNLSGLGTTFFLEDFEDNVLTPGLGTVVGYSASLNPQFGNSVDIDDGVLDDFDNGGSSIRAFGEFGGCIGSNCTAAAQWTFSPPDLPDYPTAVGIVLTASNGAAGKIMVGAFDGYTEFSIEGIVSDPFDASDDLFIGIINPSGIGSVYFQQFTRSYAGTPYFLPSFDHLQYGQSIPEPSSFLLAILAAGWYAARMPFEHAY